MTLREELEILRGEPIEVFTGDPMDIPCIETSDSEKLCRHPVVSVPMCTYNREPYIRRAIDGVMKSLIGGYWEVEKIWFAVRQPSGGIVYEPLSTSNIQREDALGEFLNRPLFILRSARI